jgi:SAM-dependent methyltransferase
VTRSRSEESGTWHYGLMARWWREFNVAQQHELAYYKAAIQRFGEPVVDLGCGTGRFLIPLAAEGFDVDGTDASADMIAQVRAQAENLRLKPTLLVQALHELELKRRYRTMYMCGVLGIGGRRDRDRQALQRAYEYLEPGGALLIIHVLPYDVGQDMESWAQWLPAHRTALPGAWPPQGDRRRCADGDEIETLSRSLEFDPLRQRQMLEIRALLWHEGRIVKEESYRLRECLYFAQEILLMLQDAGFRDVAIEGDYSGQPASIDDDTVIFVAQKQAV